MGEALDDIARMWEYQDEEWDFEWRYPTNEEVKKSINLATEEIRRKKNMSEITPVQTDVAALFPTYQEVQEKKVSALSGMSGAQVALPSITLAYQAGIFMMGEQRMENFEAEFIYGRFDLRRNYEKEYKEGVTESPNCFSYDAKGGSTPPETRVYKGKEVQVYGNCDDCYFSQFGTAGIWKGEQFVRGGPQCNRYALLFATMNGNPVIIQVPPSGTNSVQNALYQTSAAKGQIPQMIRWKFMPSGGGRSKDYMTAMAVGTLDAATYERNREIFMSLWNSGIVQNTIDRFVNPVSKREEN